MTGSGVGYKEKRQGTNGLDHKCSTGRGSQMTRWDLWPRNKPLPQVTVKFGDRAFRSGSNTRSLTWVAKIITQKRSCARSPRQSEKSLPPSLSPFPLLGASGHARHKSICDFPITGVDRIDRTSRLLTKLEQCHLYAWFAFPVTRLTRMQSLAFKPCGAHSERGPLIKTNKKGGLGYLGTQ